MSKLSPARKLALDVLMEADRRGMYARDVLSSRASAKAIDQRDSAFAARLALGVAATQGILDELLDQFLDKPKKVAPRVRMALRISAFEMLYLHTPGRVAVSQGVELVRSGAKSAAGLANAVLHKVADNVEDFAAAAGADESERRLVRLSRLMGMPRWLCARIMASFDTPEGALNFAGNLAPAPLALHENAFATKPDPYLSQLVAPVFPGCHAPVDAQATVASGVFERAAAVASDLNAQLIATAATRPGRCLEIGAGRGTKTYVMMCQAKRAGYDRQHTALDLHDRKCDQNLARLHKAGIKGVRTVSGDACELDAVLTSFDAMLGKPVLFDTVFIDAPCSGTGTMRRHPEIPWRLTEKDVRTELPRLQLTMLKEAAARVAAGGELIYATCSVFDEENTQVVDAFLASPEGTDFSLAPLSEAQILQLPEFEQAKKLVSVRQNDRGLFQSVPVNADSYDGHFCARLVRK
ncbi:MAG: RsmB/NOP family class I SAM-dependent RNA methyltransferase [Collinsella aerofaciens]